MGGKEFSQQIARPSPDWPRVRPGQLWNLLAPAFPPALPAALVGPPNIWKLKQSISRFPWVEEKKKKEKLRKYFKPNENEKNNILKSWEAVRTIEKIL